MKSEDIISFVLTHKNEEKIPYLREHIAHILNYLVSVPKFSPEKANQFIIFALECITDASNGVTLEQYDLFKAATGVQFSYEDLKNYFEQNHNEENNEYFLKAVASYDQDTRMSVVAFAATIFSAKEMLEYDELGYMYDIENAEKVLNDMEEEEESDELDIPTVNEDDLGVSSKALQIQDAVMGMPREQRKETFKNFTERIYFECQGKGIAKDQIDSILLHIALVAARFNVYDFDNSSIYSLVSDVIDIAYDDFYENMEVVDVFDTTRTDFIKETGFGLDFAIWGACLASMGGIFPSDTLEFIDKFL